MVIAKIVLVLWHYTENPLWKYAISLFLINLKTLELTFDRLTM